VLLVWTYTSYSSFWIRSNHYETWRSHAISQLQTHRANEAEYSLERALQLNPDDIGSHYILADMLTQEGRTAAAVQEYNAILKIRPDSPGTLNAMAQILANGKKEDVERAVQLAGRACDLTGYRQTDLVYTLALAQANAGQTNDAVLTAEKAYKLAMHQDQAGWARQVQGLIERLGANKVD
jgi:Tfp pilus assembly protein PilF